MSPGSVVIVLLAVALLVAAVMLVRSRNPNPWPPIVTAMVTSGVCFTIGGASAEDTTGPSVATVAAAVVGLLSVAAAIVALVPRSRQRPPSRLPMMLSIGGILIGAAGLVLNLLVG